MARHKKRIILFWKSISVFAVSLTMTALYGCGGGGGGSGSNDAADDAAAVSASTVSASNVNATAVSATTVSATTVNAGNDVYIGGNLDVVGTGDFHDTLIVSPIESATDYYFSTTVTSAGVIETNGNVTLNAAPVTVTIGYTDTVPRFDVNNDPTDCDPSTTFCQEIGGSDVGSDGIYYGDVIQTISGVTDTPTNTVDVTASDVVVAAINSSISGAWTGTLTNSDEISVGVFGVIYEGGGKLGLRLLVDSGECAGTEYSSGAVLFDDEANSEDITGEGDIAGIAAQNCVFGHGSSTTSGTIDFIISGDNLTGTYSTEADSGTLSLTYDSVAVSPITSVDLEGNWTLLSSPFLEADITVDSNGDFTGTDPSDCDTLEGKVNVVDPESLLVSVELSASNCNIPGKIGTGGLAVDSSALLIFETAGDVIYIMYSVNPLSSIFK